MLYRVIGISKQAVSQATSRQHQFDEKLKWLIPKADAIRREHPGCGVEKMYYTLKPDFMGRDRFIDVFMGLGYRVKRSRNFRRTTIASKIYYPNLIQGHKVDAPSRVWQSDITFISMSDKFCYAVFIIDVYSKKIVGYQVSEHMRASANVRALQMALQTHKPPQIHHSDRGSQYISKEYVSLLTQHNCKISMGLTAQDNAYAERFHRTIKEEYLDYWKPKTFAQLKYQIRKAVKNYNSKRIHQEIKRETPLSLEYLFSTQQVDDSFNITIFKP